MEKHLESIEVECECGKTHSLLELNILWENNDAFFQYSIVNQYTVIRLFVNELFKDDFITLQFKDKCMQNNIKVIVSILNINHAEIIKANDIDFLNEDYIIALGSADFIDVVKYYAGSVGVPFSIILTHDFLDYTFSKYARLYDGLSFSFYDCEAPEFVLCYKKFFEHIDILKLKNYLLCKKLALFENILCENIEDKKYCKKINIRLKKIISKSKSIINISSLIREFVFLGRSMSFFSCSKWFFGAELDLAGMIEVKTHQKFIDCYLFSGEVITSIYEKALYSSLSIFNLNLNKRLNKIKQILNVSATKCLTFLKKPKSLEQLSKNINIVMALKYMFLSMLDDMTYKNSFKISSYNLSCCIYTSPEFSIRYTFLNFLRDLGYLENIV